MMYRKRSDFFLAIKEIVWTLHGLTTQKLVNFVLVNVSGLIKSNFPQQQNISYLLFEFFWIFYDRTTSNYYITTFLRFYLRN